VRFITVEILPPERVPIILNHFPESWPRYDSGRCSIPFRSAVASG
jgi:hypothetical protein